MLKRLASALAISLATLASVAGAQTPVCQTVWAQNVVSSSVGSVEFQLPRKHNPTVAHLLAVKPRRFICCRQAGPLAPNNSRRHHS